MDARHLENSRKKLFSTIRTRFSRRRLPGYKEVELVFFEIVCLLLFLLFRSSSILIAPRIIVGIFSLLILPGYFLVRTFNFSSDLAEILALSPLLGLLYQLFFVYLMFASSALFEKVNLLRTILPASLFPIILFLMKFETKTNTRDEPRKTLLHPVWFGILAILGLALRMIYQRISINPHTDTSLFCEMARNLVESGRFTSKVIIIRKPSYFQQGFNPHLFTYFSYALFFLIGGVSYSSVKLATIFYGMTAIFLIYFFTRRFYCDEIASITLLLMMFHPIIVFFSSIPINGSEIVGITFLFSTVYFFSISLTEKYSRKYIAIAGLSAFATLASRAEYFYIYVLCAPLLLLSLTGKKRGFLGFILACLTLYLNFLLRFCDFMAIPSSYLHLSIPIAILAFCLALGLSKRVDREIMGLIIFNLTIASLMALSLPKLYLLFRSPQPPLHDILTKRKEEVVPELLKRTLLVSENFEAIFSRFQVLWYTAFLKLSGPISVLSLSSLFCLRKFSCNLFLTLYALAFSIIFSLTQTPIGGVDHHRFLLAIFFISMIFSAQTIKIVFDRLKSYINRGPSIGFCMSFELGSKRWHSCTRKLNLGIMTTMLALTLVFSIFLHPLYLSEVYVVKSTDIKVAYRYDEAIDWVVQNTKSDSILMAYKPYEWAWYTNRTSLMPWPLYLNSTQLNELIKLFKVNYLILDEAFYYSYSDKEVRSLYLVPKPQSGFLRVFSSSTEPRVVIYNVTSVWSGESP